MEETAMSVNSEKQGVLQVIYNVVIPGDNQELTISAKYIGSWQSTWRKIYQVEWWEAKQTLGLKMNSIKLNKENIFKFNWDFWKMNNIWQYICLEKFIFFKILLYLPYYNPSVLVHDTKLLFNKNIEDTVRELRKKK